MYFTFHRFQDIVQQDVNNMLYNNLSRELKVFIDLLGTLDKQEKDLLIWRFYMGYSMKETAELMLKKHKRQMTDSRIKQVEDKLLREIQLEFELFL